MREIEVKTRNGKFNGRYKVYQLGEAECPVLTNRLVAVNGDWIADDKGVVAQILHIRTQQAKKFSKFICTTAFGADALRFVYRESRAVVPTLEFERPRVSFSVPHRNTVLTPTNKLFIQLVAQMGDVTTAYRMMGKRHDTNPARPRQLLRFLLDTEDGRRYFQEMLGEEAKKRNLDKESYYLDKLEAALGDGIKSDLQLRILKILSVAGGNPEIIRMLQEDIDAGLVPSTFSNDNRLDKAEEVKALPENSERLKT